MKRDRGLFLWMLLAGAGTAVAQEKPDNVLTPTDILEAAQISLTGAFRLSLGGADLRDKDGGWKLDVDTEGYDLFFEAGVGLGRGFEIVASVPYEIRGLVEGESGGVEYDVESYRFGDLTLQGNYRILKEEKETPQWVAGVILVAPVGYWKEADPTIRVGGTTIVEGDKGGTGEGVWRYGLGTAISKRFGLFEPYLGGAFLFGGETERKDIEYDRPDVGQVFVGAEFHVSPEAAIDVRGEVQFTGEQVETDKETGGESTEEKHQTYILTAQVYARLAPGVTLFAGGGLYTISDHWVNREDRMELEGHLAYVLQMGLQVVLGGW